MSAQGEIVSVNISTEKGTRKVPVPTVVVDPQGIVGDAHAGPWHRQVSFLSEESITRFSARAGRPIEPGEFAENFTLRGIDFARIGLRDRFLIGSVELVVTQLGKKCHGDTCAIFREVGSCIMPKEGVFCQVLRGGSISRGDEVCHIPERRGDCGQSGESSPDDNFPGHP